MRRFFSQLMVGLPEKCPHCESQDGFVLTWSIGNMIRRVASFFIWVVLLVLGGLLLEDIQLAEASPRLSYRWRCLNCHKRFRAKINPEPAPETTEQDVPESAYDRE